MRNPVARASSAVFIGSLTFLATLSGCGGSSAWNQAYKANYKWGYKKSFQEGWIEGSRAGSAEGKGDAELAIKTSIAWRPYRPLLFWSAFFGIACGVLVQYIVLLTCNIPGRASLFWLVTLVPGSRSSLTYQFFNHRRRLELHHAEQLGIIETTRDVEFARLEAAKAAALNRISAAVTIEELSQIRLLDLAQIEMSQVVSRAEATLHASDSMEEPPAVLLTCPHCRKLIGYKSQASGKTVACPHNQCRKPVYLPPTPRPH